MSNIFTEYENVIEAIEKLCNKEDLSFRINKASFPIIMTFEPNDNNQMSLTESDDKEKGSLHFIFDEDFIVKVKDGFLISDSSLNKLKNNAKKLHYAYLQIYFNNKEKKGKINEFSDK